MITDAEKKVLLERLALARAAKVAKKAEKDATSKAIAVTEPVSPGVPAAPAPPAAPAHAPTPAPAAPAAPSIPDTDHEEVILPKKMKSKPMAIPEKREKAAAYMKIKIYTEPKYPERLNQLLLAVNGNEGDDCNEETPEPVHAIPPVKPPRHLVQHHHSYPLPKLVLNNDWARKELLRRQAIEFFG